MRFVRPLLVSGAALGVVACTAILGDFDIDKAGAGDDAGNDSGGVETGGDAGSISVTPGDSKMGIFRSATFTATEDVTWSVQEPEGGLIDDKGVFLSGGKPGTYHIVAKSKADPSRSGTVPVVVVNLAINLLAGPNGGAGNIDGVTRVAHFNAPQGVASYYDEGTSSRMIFVADTQNHTIRGWSEKAGKVTTIAGKAGVPGTADGV